MKTILVTGHGVRLRYRKGLLVIETKKEEKQELPLFDVDQIVIATSGIWFSSKLIRKIIEHGIDLVVLDSRGYPVGRVYPPFINRTVDTRRAQYNSYSTHKGTHVIKEIVYSKLMNQAGLLKKYYYYNKIDDLKNGYEKIHDLAIKARTLNTSFHEAKESLRTIEAEAARIYWTNYALLVPKELGFDGRDQDSQDPTNMSLNYAYGILYGECWKALVLAGLDPYAGFLHEDRSGKPVLTFDFIEMFRFIADSVIINLLRHSWKPKIYNGLLDYESRTRIIESINRFIDSSRGNYIDETPNTLRQIIKKVALTLASYLRDETVFTGYVHRW